MARSGITGFTLLHGVENSEELYYASEIQEPAKQYVACLSGDTEEKCGYFRGRVTEYIHKKLLPKTYDFYLCGRQEMIRDVTLMVDERFTGSYIYTELFY
jgi:NAD(P)H-flavin reductase